MNTVDINPSSSCYPQQLRVNFMKLQMTTLISYAKAFGLKTTSEMSHMEIANTVANHFVSNPVDEVAIIHEFYEKTEAIKRNPPLPYQDSSSYSASKRQSKKPKKFSQVDDSTYHYNTRSRATDNSDKDIDESSVNPDGGDNNEYCICGKPENDYMVECENPDCKHKWFHYACMGISDPENLPAKWYCPECSSSMK